ncbi:MAG TPA: hypothetical protein VN911_08715 [Candidatus Acidoferrum sp.]|nr:hypothetical protein [Candidatus Acidoferrum sp.]
MWRRCLCAGVIGCCAIASFLISSVAITSFALAAALPSRAAVRNANEGKDKDSVQRPVLRWDEQQPGCTFSRGDDGKYSYGIWSGDVGVVVAVDARELQIIRRRVQPPVFAVLITMHNRGAKSVDAAASGITLQFINHFKVTQSSLDPDAYIRKVQSDADALDDETRREIKKHPEQRQVRETRLQQYQKSVNELIEFLGKSSLREAVMDSANPEVHGWVFFDANTKWLGAWKAQEELVLRVPVDEKVFEFPFKLPPERGEFILQKR